MSHVLNFNVLKRAVAARFAEMSKHQLFRVAIPKDEDGAKSNLLWETYLAAFPEGTDPMYRKRTEHDCSCCRKFIRDIGDVVVVINGKMVSIWDIDIGDKEPAYQAVADALSKVVKAHAIGDAFLHYEPHAGTDKNFEQLLNDRIQQWDHFYVTIPAKFVRKNKDIASELSVLRSNHDVLLRALTELTDDAVDTVLELIAQNTLLRGAEHKFAVIEFRKLQTELARLPTDQRDFFAWTKALDAAVAGSVTGFRNTAIGTLVVDLSAGVDLEAAVKKFEFKVGGPNYKRPTALATPGMIKKAKEALEEKGLISAMQRRYAVLPDITINNVLFANRNARKVLTTDVFDELSESAAVNMKSFDKIDSISIEDFLANVVPTAKSIEVLLENKHESNLVSLIAPEDPTAGELFKWANRFSWSYNGDMADSVKERVKAAGGSVTGDLCCRLAWDYADDLDLHMVEPTGYEISFGNRRTDSSCGGQLDLDANGGDGPRKDPAENIVYADRRKMREGVYELFVHNWARRSDDKGFRAEIEFDGVTHQISYDRAIANKATVVIAKIRFSHKNGFEIIESLPSTASSKNVWGLKTQVFQQVNVLMLSPNFWDGGTIGNKHFFFMLDGCANGGVARGFFNEFLKAELDPHRKAMEMVGSKLKTAKAEEQLSGLGFSSTQRNTLICRVKGSFIRTLKVQF